jgi:hypothetical protein
MAISWFWKRRPKFRVHRLTRLRPSRYTNHIASTDVIDGRQERSESLAERNRIASPGRNSVVSHLEERRCSLIRSVRWSCIIGSGRGRRRWLRVIVPPPAPGSSTVLTSSQCKIYATDCQQLGLAGDISMQRATILMAMSRSWTTLANQVLRYDTIVKEEDK